MNTDDLKKLTTASLDRLAALLDVGQSDGLAAILKVTLPVSVIRPDATATRRFRDRRRAAIRPSVTATATATSTSFGT